MIGVLIAASMIAGFLVALPARAAGMSPTDLPRAVALDFRNLVTTKENLVITAAGAGAAFAASSLDHRIVESRFNSEVREETTLDHVFEPGYYLGGAIQIGCACATYGLGIMMGKPEAQSLGADLIRAQLVTSSLTLALKKAVGRERPDLSNNDSFPSGHASGTFATAAVLQKRYGLRAGLPAYLLASYVAASRLNESQHFLSDIVAGAALGFMVGRTVTQDHHDGRLGIYPTFSPDGVGFRFVLRPLERAPSPDVAHAAIH